MKQDTINKFIAFFRMHDINLLDNPAQLKAQFLGLYGPEYKLEITVFCNICTSAIVKNMNSFDKDNIIANAIKINQEYKINEKVAVLFLGCFAYIKKLIPFDTLKEFTLYRPAAKENNVGSENQITEDTAALKKPGGESPAIGWIAIVCAVLGSTGIVTREWGVFISLVFSVLAIILGSKAKKLDGKDGKRGFYAWLIGIIFTAINAIKIAIGLFLIFWAFRLFGGLF